MIDSLYSEKSLVGRLRQYFSIYFKTFSSPTARALFLLALSTFAMESADSIRSLYRRFLSGITLKSLTAFCHACSYSKAGYSRSVNVTTSPALRPTPDFLKLQLVFFCIDDTVISKFEKKFGDISRLSNHAAHNGSNYLNGHYFVSLILCVPIWSDRRTAYLTIPLGYHVWQKEQSKLGLTVTMVRQVMPSLASQKNITILCDSWYIKKNSAYTIDEYPDPDLICDAKADLVIYDLAP